MYFLRLSLVLIALASIAILPTSAQAKATFSSGECLATAPSDRTVDCGTVTLPLSADAPNGAQIQLPIMIVRSTESNNNRPLFLLQGGPGGNTIETFVSILTKPSSGLPSDRDLVLVEQRGTTETTPTLNCPELSAITPELYASQMTNVQRTDRHMRAWQACADRLRAANIDLSAFNSTANADDIAAVASMLGHDSIDVYGVSYGSLLAQHVVARHPELVHALVLDGVVPMTVSPQTQWIASRQQSFAHLFADCAADPVCNAHYPALTTRLPELIATLNASPLSTSLTDIATATPHTMVLNGDDVAGLFFQMMYDDELVRYVPMLIDQIERNDLAAFRSLAGLFLFYDGMSEGMQATTTCAEESIPTAADYTVPVNGLFPLDDTLVADDIDYTTRWCAIADVKRLDAAVNTMLTSDVPTLISSGRYDPITPESMVQAVVPGLRNATVIVTPNGAHGAILGNVCAASIFRAFLDAPEQTPDTSCLATQTTAFVTTQTVTPTSAAAQLLNGVNPLGSYGYPALAGLLWLIFSLLIRPFAYLIRRVRGIAAPKLNIRFFHVVQLFVAIAALAYLSGVAYILYDSALVQNSVAFLFGIPHTLPGYSLLLWAFPATALLYLLLWVRILAARDQTILGFVYALSIALAAGSLLAGLLSIGLYAVQR